MTRKSKASRKRRGLKPKPRHSGMMYGDRVAYRRVTARANQAAEGIERVLAEASKPKPGTIIVPAAQPETKEQRGTIMAEDAADNTQKKKEYEKLPYATWQANCSRLGMAPELVCEAIGYTGKAYREWEKTGLAPKVAVIASEALVRRNGGNKPTYLVIKCDDKEALAGLELLLGRFAGCSIEATIKP